MCPLTSAYQVDDNTVIETQNGDFNYTFPSDPINFTIIQWWSDTIMLNYTNFTIIPASGTANATVYEVRTPIINFTICGDDQNVNMSLANMSVRRVLTITTTTTTNMTISNDENITINATSDCLWVAIRADASVPQFTFQGDTPADGTTYSTTDRVDINVSYTELYEDTCFLNWSGTSSNYTMTMDKTADTCVYTIGNIPDGTYTYYVWLNDTSGNSNTTATRTFTCTFIEQGYIDNSGDGEAGGGGATYVPPTIPTVENITDIIEDVVEDIIPTTIYVSEQASSKFDDFMDWMAGYWNQSVYDFPACDVWNMTAVNETSGEVQPECVEHRHLQGNVVLIAGMLALISFVVWFAHGLIKG